MFRTRIVRSALFAVSFFAAAPVFANARNVVNFPSVPNIPIKPGLSYGGYFKHHQPVKILFAVGQPGEQTSESLVNAALVIKYLVHKGYKYKIHFVFYSKGILVTDRLSQKYSAGWGPLLHALHKRGVTFSVCHNAMALLHVHTNEIYPFMQVIPAGILSVVEYEGRGYFPVFNPNSVTGASLIHVKR